MRRLLTRLGMALALLPLATAQAQSVQQADLDALRAEIRAMQADYEARIADLEARLEVAERAAAAPAAASATASYEPTVMPSAETVSVAQDNSFNPAIGVTFQGQAWSYGDNPDDYMIPGFPLGGEAGPAPEGLSLAETEITMSANVDDKFTAMLNLPIVVENGGETAVEIEEAWVETLALPAGLALRMGRFYSNIGYLNTRHFHSWDFTDQPLVYQAFLGNQFLDDGVQLRWLAPTDFYLEFSGELLRGDHYPAAGAGHSGVGAHTLGAKTGGDVGFSSSWQFGLAWLSARADDRESGSEDDPLYFTGDTDLYIADFVWKWAPNGNWRERNFVFQAEYLWRQEDGDYTDPGNDVAGPWNVDQQGWYAQAVFQPIPQWRVGLRYDRLYSDNPGPYWADTPLFPVDDPDRISLMVDWSNSEFSRVRFQYNYDDAGFDGDNEFGLQYIYSIGAHGAHSF